MNRNSAVLISLIVFSAPAFAQNPAAAPAPVDASASAVPQTAIGPTAQPAPTDYVLGPFDQIAVVVGEFEEQFSDRTFRLDGNGDVSLPLVGRLHAGGLTLGAFEENIKKHLGQILKNPDVVVNITDFASQTLSILGAVNLPGNHQLVGQKSLFDMLSVSQGLTDDAGTTVQITRLDRWGPLPLPEATLDTATETSTATVRVKDIVRNGPENITVLPGDIIFVPRADRVYAVGSVNKPGGFAIGENESLSALQVVSLAQGLDKTAAANKAEILRVVPGQANRDQIPIDIKRLMAGKTPDIPLRANDILFVPNSGAKSLGLRSMDAIINAATGLALYGSKL